MVKKPKKCDGITIYEDLKPIIDDKEHSIAYIDNMLQHCIPEPEVIVQEVQVPQAPSYPQPQEPAPRKRKRSMSWYNCCTKIEAKGKSFSDVITSGVCKRENLSQEQIEKYKKLAQEGCPL